MKMQAFVILLASLVGCTVAYPSYGQSQARGCPHVVIANGKYSPRAPWFPYQVHRLFTKIEYTCDSGYNLNGPSYAYCQYNSKWTGIPTCVPIANVVTCERPSYIVHGSMSSTANTFTVGQTVTYLCQSGYEMIGEATLSCRNNGLFDRKPPTCQEIPQVQYCVVPKDALVNMKVKYNKISYRPSQLAQFFCDNGYKMEGQQYIFCGYNGEFMGEIPQCKRDGCKALNVDANTFVSPYKQQYAVGESITFSCQGDYHLAGHSMATCMSSGEFNASTPQCNMPAITPVTTTTAPSTVCQLPSDLSNYEITTNQTVLEVGDRFIAGCKAGYLPLRRFSIICDTDGTLLPPLPDCVVSTCTVPDLSQYLSVIDQPEDGILNFGDIIKYQCEEGFKLHGNEIDFCGENGIFTSPPPQCIGVDVREGDNFFEESTTCLIPNLTPNLIFVSEAKRSVAEGAFVEYMCRIGFKLVGSYKLECLESGDLSSKPPTCELIFTQCKLPDIKEMQLIEPGKETFVEGEIVRFECDNIAKKREFEIRCGKDGEFEGDMNACEVNVNCPLPKIPFYGYAFSKALSKPRLETGDVIYFRCRSGYKIIGPQQLVCQQNGEFLPSEETRCIPDGQIKKTSS